MFGGPDGTDPDWFLLTVQGWDESDQLLGEVEFYLADYRFEDSSLDYVVDEWAEVDISSLKDAASLSFKLTSSDVGQFGMNTPAYFAVDNLVLARERVPVYIDVRSVSEGDGTNAAVGLVGRVSSDASQPLTVQSSSTDTSEIEVPPAVTIPAGDMFAEFPIHAVDDDLVDGTQTVAILADADGYATGVASISVLDDDVLRLTVTADPGSISEADAVTPPAATGSVHRNTDDVSQPLTVLLTADDDTELLVPDSVVIPIGETSAEFPISAVDDAVVDGTQSAAITAIADGYLAGTVNVDVLDDDVLSLAVEMTPGVISESTARPTARFEDLGATIGTNSYWNGSDNSGGFNTDGLMFNNKYDAAWGSWSPGEVGDDLVDAWRRGIELIASVCEEAMQQGDMHEGDPNLSARLMVATQQVFMSAWVESGMKEDPDTLADRIEAQLERALLRKSQ